MWYYGMFLVVSASRLDAHSFPKLLHNDSKYQYP